MPLGRRNLRHILASTYRAQKLKLQGMFMRVCERTDSGEDIHRLALYTPRCGIWAPRPRLKCLRTFATICWARPQSFLSAKSESGFQEYLVWRWGNMEQRLGPAPTGSGAIAKMRLVTWIKDRSAGAPITLLIRWFLWHRLPGTHGAG